MHGKTCEVGERLNGGRRGIMEASSTTAVVGAAILGVFFVVVFKLVSWISTTVGGLWTTLLGG